MLVIKWAPVGCTDRIPPFGEQFRNHLASYKGKVKTTSCSAWNLLERVLEENDCPVSEVFFTDNGKPYFNDSDVFFSISHSKGLCAVAVSNQPVGIDIELCREKYNSRMVERSLTEKEKVSFDGDFTRIWCRKEAIAKATGIGITGYPDDIDTTEYHFIEQRIKYNGNNYWVVTSSLILDQDYTEN